MLLFAPTCKLKLIKLPKEYQVKYLEPSFNDYQAE